MYTRVQACLCVSPRSKSSPEVTQRRQWRRACGWQGTPSHQTEWSQGGHGTGSLPPTQTCPRWGQPWGQEHLPPGAWASPALEPRAPQSSRRLRALSPPNTSPNFQVLPKSPRCLQPPVQRAQWLFSSFFINIIYKDGSSKKAEMRRLGGRGRWLRSGPPGWDC